MPRFPIVLAHGIARFDALTEKIENKLKLPETVLSDQLEYFKGIKSHLEAHGFVVSHPNQGFAASADLRATQLRDRVNAIISTTGSPKVHIIGHSMGGLDARHMIVDHGMAERVASLTTIGTPHHGSPVADHIKNKPGGKFLLKALSQVLNLNIDGVNDLTTAVCESFNRRAEDAEARNPVKYQTYSAFEDVGDVFLPLMASWVIVNKQEGPNDGLVSVQSQQWAKELRASDGTSKPIDHQQFQFGADHLNEVGWWDSEEIINPLQGSNLLKQKLDYEKKVRDLYLAIAENTTQSDI
jgi:Predicted acetyltransferases and hydrolases with the alpha/beta hydrolase fold